MPDPVIKCNRCRGRLVGGAAGDAVRDPRKSGYVHAGACPKDVPVAPSVPAQRTVKPKPKPKAKAKPKARAHKVSKPKTVYQERSCDHSKCEQRFVPRTARMRYCSARCRDNALHQRMRAARRPLRTCVMCGVELGAGKATLCDSLVCQRARAVQRKNISRQRLAQAS